MTFKNTLKNAKGDVQIDFGDGTPLQPVQKTIQHAYERPGIYTASLQATGVHGDPATVRIRVVVEGEGE